MTKKTIIVLALSAVVVVSGLGAWYLTKGRDSGTAKESGQFNNFGGPMGAAGAGQGRSRGDSNYGNAAGKIISKDDASITIELSKGGSVIAFYSGSTKILKIVDAEASDLAVGQTVTGRGVKNDDGSISVNTLQMRTAAGSSDSSAPRNATGTVGQMPNRQDGGGGQANTGFVSGQITVIDGNTIKVKSPNGSEQTIKLADGIKISKLVEAQASDLAVDTEVMATGTKNADGSISAQLIQIGGIPGGFPARGKAENGESPAKQN